jgi:hypothetical protein
MYLLTLIIIIVNIIFIINNFLIKKGVFMGYGAYGFNIEGQSRIYDLVKMVAGVEKFTLLDKIQVALISFKQAIGFELDKKETAKITVYKTVTEMTQAAAQCFKVWDRVFPSPQRDALLSKPLETLVAGFESLQCSSADIVAPYLVYQKTGRFISQLQVYNSLSS